MSYWLFCGSALSFRLSEAADLCVFQKSLKVVRHGPVEGGRLTGGVQLLLVLTHQDAALDILTCKQVIISMCCTRMGHRQQERRVIVEVHVMMTSTCQSQWYWRPGWRWEFCMQSCTRAQNQGLIRCPAAWSLSFLVHSVCGSLVFHTCDEDWLLEPW